MIRKEEVERLVEQVLENDQEFLLAVTVSPRDEIRVYIDSMDSISIERCVEISRAIEASLNREEEDYSLEVSSAGLGEPFVHPRQYQKHLDNPVSVVLKSGLRYDGILREAKEEGFTLEVSKVIPAYKDEQGKKHKKELRTEELFFPYEEVKSTAYRFLK